MAIDSSGNAFLVEGRSVLNDSARIPESTCEVQAEVDGKIIPLYYYVGGSKIPVVDRFYGDALGPDIAEVTGSNQLTVVFRTKASAYVTGNYGWITIANFALDTGIITSQYNFSAKRFDSVSAGDSRSNGPYPGLPESPGLSVLTGVATHPWVRREQPFARSTGADHLAQRHEIQTFRQPWVLT